MAKQISTKILHVILNALRKCINSKTITLFRVDLFCLIDKLQLNINTINYFTNIALHSTAFMSFYYHHPLLHSFSLPPPHSPPLLYLSYTLSNFEVPQHYLMIIFKFSSFEYFPLPAIKVHDITTSFSLLQYLLLLVLQPPHTPLF